MGRTCNTCIYCIPNKYSEHGYRCDCGDDDYAAELEIEGVHWAEQCNMYQKVADYNYGYIQNDKALRFILAGRCEFIAVSGNTGVKLEYQLVRKESKRNNSEFVYFLKTKVNGNMQYAGIIFYNESRKAFVFNRGLKGSLPIDHINIKSILFILNNLNRRNTALNLKIYHLGKCGRCGRKLTTEESILTGLGPTCAKISNIPRVKV